MTDYRRRLLREYRTIRQLSDDYERGIRPQLVWTDHAYHRYIDMKKQAALTGQEVADAIVAPERIFMAWKHNAVCLTHGRITASVIVGNDGLPLVATLLWATQEDWENSYQGGDVVGRDRRDDLSHLPSRKRTA